MVALLVTALVASLTTAALYGGMPLCNPKETAMMTLHVELSDLFFNFVAINTGRFSPGNEQELLAEATDFFDSYESICTTFGASCAQDLVDDYMRRV